MGSHPLFEWLLLELKLQVEQLVLVAEQLYLSFYSFQERFALKHEQLVHVMHALLVHDFLQLCFVKDGDRNKPEDFLRIHFGGEHLLAPVDQSLRVLSVHFLRRLEEVQRLKACHVSSELANREFAVAVQVLDVRLLFPEVGVLLLKQLLHVCQF